MSAALLLGILSTVSSGNGKEGSTWEVSGEVAGRRRLWSGRRPAGTEAAGCGCVGSLQGEGGVKNKWRW